NGRENKKSTGIGLYLCKRIMDQLCHKIRIDSTPGEGTVVTLDLNKQQIFLE
ncbi:ATP-binding protein, partial [Eubacterium aggregans]